MFNHGTAIAINGSVVNIFEGEKMIFYLTLVVVFGMLFHFVFLAFNRRDTIFPDGSIIQEKLVLNYSLEKILTRSYVLLTSLVLIVFFGFISVFAGSLLGMYLFLAG